ncbi:MAG: GAF domain-containing protein [Deltaproteobacteria bacterium]|nr:GAF domain-containing protein [Deltaproteobacteria bacterium]
MLLETYFENGRQIAGELVSELEAARRRIAELENENARQRMQLKSDSAIRELITKIESLETEREELESRTDAVVLRAQSESERAAAIEQELSNLASLYVAALQLHSSFDPREVVATLGQLLLQFLGAGAYVIYAADRDKLVAVLSEGLAQDLVKSCSIDQGFVGQAVRSAQPFVVREDGTNDPLVVVPLRVGDQLVGVVAVFQLLEQKPSLSPFDLELLQMVSSQGAMALAAARLAAALPGGIPDAIMGIQRT